MFPLIIGVAAFVDGLATGIWVGKKWMSKAALEASVKTAIAAATLPDIVPVIISDVKAVADKVTEVATQVNPAIASLAVGANDLRSLLAAATAAK